jgi:hypothetical protein
MVPHLRSRGGPQTGPPPAEQYTHLPTFRLAVYLAPLLQYATLRGFHALLDLLVMFKEVLAPAS